MERRGVHTQIVTIAFRIIPAEWQNYEHLNVVISVDGLPAEHDVRRKPATYERILKNIQGAKVTIHCPVTSQINRSNHLLNASGSGCMYSFAVVSGAHDADALECLLGSIPSSDPASSSCGARSGS
jgi:hypothetical protein